MAETFYLSVVSPQKPAFNRGYWRRLENYIRDLAVSNDSIQVYTGPLYLAYNDTDGKRYVKYRVIGPNDVAVPTHFFKIIVIRNFSRDVSTQSFIIPNEEISLTVPLENFETCHAINPFHFSFAL